MRKYFCLLHVNLKLYKAKNTLGCMHLQITTDVGEGGRNLEITMTTVDSLKKRVLHS